MTTILDELASHARERVAEAKGRVSLDEMKDIAHGRRVDVGAFERALARPGVSFICECKRASPSKGIIADDYPYARIASEYEAAGADCISVLTEPKWFLGSGGHLREIADIVGIPCLRKDFVVDEYMIYEARALGASAVLLICAILGDGELERYVALCGELGLSALVESHDADEVSRAVRSGARIIGVNNRDLRDFSVDTDNSRRLRDAVPSGTLFVSESGIKSAQDVAALRDAGVDAVLVGETMMRAPDKRAKLAELRGEKVRA